MICVIVLSCQFSSECQATILLADELVHGWWCWGGWTLHLCTRSLHQPGLWLAAGSPSLTSHWSNAPTLCVVSTPFLQNTIPGSCSGLERCPSNLHTTSSSHIGYLIVSHFSHWLSLASMLTWLLHKGCYTLHNKITNSSLKSWICSFMFLSMNENFWSV